MGKFKEIFNFDNIGGKIKTFAKLYCWIAIILIWIVAPIVFIDLVSDDWTAELSWIPLVSAIFGPLLVWVGSWGMYAFGELVEKTGTNENNTRQILLKLNEKPVEKTGTNENNTRQILLKLNEKPVEEKHTPKNPTPSSTKPKKEEKNWADTSSFSETDKGTIICSQCKLEQPSGRSVCWNCGAKFE